MNRQIKNIVTTFLRDNFAPPHAICENQQAGSIKRRIEYIDLVKGVCIILVILAHFDDSFAFVNSQALRMPLYFLLSGLFFKTYGSLKIFLIKKINNLLIPFVFWFFLSFCIVYIGRRCFLHENYAYSHLIEGFFTHEIPFNIALWFLFCLFVVNMIFYALQCRWSGVFLFIGVVISALVGNLSMKFDFLWPFWIDSACTALPFFYLGYILRNSNLLNEVCQYKVYTLFIGGSLIIIAYLCYFIGGHSQFVLSFNRVNGNPLIAYTNSICFVIGVLLICKVVRWLPLVSYFGRYSIIVLCSHLIFEGNIGDFCSIVFGCELSWGLRLIFFLLCCWIAIPICKFLIPWFVAQKPLIKYSIK